MAGHHATCRPPLLEPVAAPLTVSELILAYWNFVQSYYVKNGEPTSEQDTIRQALRFVRELYGSTPAAISARWR